MGKIISRQEWAKSEERKANIDKTQTTPSRNAVFIKKAKGGSIEELERQFIEQLRKAGLLSD